MKKISDKKLASLGGVMPRSSISSSSKPRKALKKVNLKAQAKRKAGYRKMLSGKEYKAARAEALARAGNRCEYHFDISAFLGFPLSKKATVRCAANEALHAHHLRYPKSRPLEARDLLILCPDHHEQAEMAKMHKTRMY